MSWLDTFFTAGIKTILDTGAALPARPNLNVIGATLADNPSTNATDLTITGGGGSTPTGTGFVHITGGTQDAAAQLVINTDVDASAAIAVTKLAAGTANYALVTNGAGTAPTYALLVNANISASAAIDVTKLAAGTANYVAVTNGAGTAAAYALLVDANVNAAAAIAGTKIAPAFGSQNITFTGYLAQGATPATEGTERLGNTDSIAFRNNANSANIYGLSKDASDYVYVGVDSAATTAKTCVRLISDCTTRTSFRCAGSEYVGIVNAGGNVQVLVGRSDLANFEVVSGGASTAIKQGANAILLTDATNVYLAKPAIGHAGSSSPYAVHGGVSVTPGSDANVTLSSSQYNQACILLQTGSWGSGHSVIFPAPASVAVGYSKMFINQSAYAATVSTGTPTTVSVGAVKAAVLWFDSTGVTRISADA